MAERRGPLPPWEALAAAVEQGDGLAAAAAAGGLAPGELARLTAKWAAAWLDVLDDVEGATVLLSDASPGRAAAALTERAAAVAVIEDDPARASVRRKLLGDRQARVAPEAELLAEQWDLVVVDGDPGGDERLRRLAGAVAPSGRLVVLTDNPWSPLRALDARTGRRVGAAWVRSLPALHRRLRSAGLVARQSFGVLRSSAAPVVAFDLAAPEARAAVVDAVNTHIHGARRAGLLMLRRLPPEAAARLVPAWLVVASRPGQWEPHPLRPTGRIGYEDTIVIKVLRGDPPAAVDKLYPSERAADAEATALEALAAAGVDVVPTVLARLGPGRARLGWVTGETLNLKSLAADDLVTWTVRAARILAQIQAVTRRPETGEVLVHGDYWLGNVLVDGDRIVAVIDWVDARWGDPSVDRRFLAGSLEGFIDSTPELLARLADAVERGMAGGAAEVG